MVRDWACDAGASASTSSTHCSIDWSRRRTVDLSTRFGCAVCVSTSRGCISAGATLMCMDPLPMLGSLPVMMFCDTPWPLSSSPKHAASHSMSGVSSNEHRSSGPVSMRLIPCRLSGMM